MKKNYNFIFGLILVFVLGGVSVFGQNNTSFLEFDGNDSFFVNDAGNKLDIVGSNWTIEAWIYPTANTVPASGTYPAIASRKYSFELYFRETSGNVGIGILALKGSGSGFDTEGSLNSGTNHLTLNKWNHIAVSSEKPASTRTTRLFINGVLVGSSTDPDFSLDASISAINIGARYDGSFVRYIDDCSIDELQYSKTARYTAAFTPKITDSPLSKDANTIILYDFDENSGTTIANDDDSDFDANLRGNPNDAAWVTWRNNGNHSLPLDNRWVWNGSASTSDLFEGNWDPNELPGGLSKIIIPTGTTFDLHFSGGNGPEFYESITLESNANIEIGQSAEVDVSNFTIASDATVDLYGKLRVTGTLSNSGGNAGLVIKSTGGGNTDGSLIADQSIAITVERNMTPYTSSTDGWHLISSPVGNFAISGTDFAPNAGEDLFEWDETAGVAGEWNNYNDDASGTTHGFTNLEKGHGYLISEKVGGTFSFAGSTVVADVRFTDLSKAYNGWHLLGNPYTSALDWSIGTWNVINFSTPQVYDEVAGDFHPVTDVNYDNIIPPSQGFFVQTTNDANNDITIPTDARSHTDKEWYKSTKEYENSLCLKLSGGSDSYSSQTTIVFDPSSTNGYDIEYDSHKLLGSSPAPKIYTIAGDNENFATNHIPPTEDEILIPANIRVFSNGEYTVSVILNTVEREGNIYLEDLKTGEFTNLSLSDTYTFQASEQDDAARFMLHFNSATGINDLENASDINIYSNNHTIYLNSDETFNGNIMIYDMGGKLILSKRIENTNMHSIPVHNLNGVYLVRFIESDQVSTQKIIIQ